MAGSRTTRYLTATVARATLATAASATALLVAVDALDPSARGAPLSELPPRALWLASASVVISLALAPASASSALARHGGLRALRAAGLDPRRALVVPLLLATLVGALATGALSLAAAHGTALHPGRRPAPFDVTPWGAPRAGRWVFSRSGEAVFTPRSGPSVVVVAPPSRGSLAPWRAPGRPAPGATEWLVMASVCAAPASLAASTGARRGGVRGVWTASLVALLALVAAVVCAGHLGAVSDTRATPLVVAAGALVGAVLGRLAGRLSG